MRRVCVFCGSSMGVKTAYKAVAGTLGKHLGSADIGLVYGGASVGLMGTVADAVLAEQGEVIGVIPQAMAHAELAHRNLSRLEVVESMHARKARMAELSDGFIALPGGFGTFEELFEILTWAQIGLHGKPCGLLNIDGFYDDLLRFLDHAAAEGFISATNIELLLVDKAPQSLIHRMNQYKPISAGKQLRKGDQKVILDLRSKKTSA